MTSPAALSGLLFRSGPEPLRPRVFVSYHHAKDQAAYDRLSCLFGESYSVIVDNSLERKVDSDDSDYVQRHVREDNLASTSLTVALCGAETWKRRWGDWGIHMTLNKQHGLLGVVLPMHATNGRGEIIVPDRLLANTRSGYAHWVHWTEDPTALKQAIDESRNLARFTARIDNNQRRMQRSRP